MTRRLVPLRTRVLTLLVVGTLVVGWMTLGFAKSRSGAATPSGAVVGSGSFAVSNVATTGHTQSETITFTSGPLHGVVKVQVSEVPVIINIVNGKPVIAYLPAPAGSTGEASCASGCTVTTVAGQTTAGGGFTGVPFQLSAGQSTGSLPSGVLAAVMTVTGNSGGLASFSGLVSGLTFGKATSGTYAVTGSIGSSSTTTTSTSTTTTTTTTTVVSESRLMQSLLGGRRSQ